MVRLRANIIMALIVVALLWVVSAFCTGCYSQKKATQQHGRAVSTYPVIGADYCARTYPCEPGPVRSDTTTVYDTLWGAAEIITDTIRATDTIYIFKSVQLPGRIITRTVTIRDTVQIKDRAELDKCAIQRDEAITRAEKEQVLKEKYQRRSRHYLYALIGIGAAGLIWLILFFRKKIVKP